MDCVLPRSSVSRESIEWEGNSCVSRARLAVKHLVFRPLRSKIRTLPRSRKRNRPAGRCAGYTTRNHLGHRALNERSPIAAHPWPFPAQTAPSLNGRLTRSRRKLSLQTGNSEPFLSRQLKQDRRPQQHVIECHRTCRNILNGQAPRLVCPDR